MNIRRMESFSKAKLENRFICSLIQHTILQMHLNLGCQNVFGLPVTKTQYSEKEFKSNDIPIHCIESSNVYMSTEVS